MFTHFFLKKYYNGFKKKEVVRLAESKSVPTILNLIINFKILYKAISNKNRKEKKKEC
jgi:hypothetical protein